MDNRADRTRVYCVRECIVCICVYLCMPLCICVCMYVCMCVCVCVCVEVLGQSNATDGVTGNKTNRTKVSLRGLYL